VSDFIEEFADRIDDLNTVIVPGITGIIVYLTAEASEEREIIGTIAPL